MAGRHVDVVWGIGGVGGMGWGGRGGWRGWHVASAWRGVGGMVG